MKRLACLTLAFSLACVAQTQAPSEDAILQSMQLELKRSQPLKLAGLDAPYYIEYTLEDVHTFTVSAALGAILGTGESRFRVPRVRVRVGDPKFDNTNYIYTDYFGGTRYDPEQFPLDDNVSVLRRGWWLATDRSFKTAVEAIGRKRAALKSQTEAEAVPDFWPAPPVQRLAPVLPFPDLRTWPERVRSASLIFRTYPEIVSSLVTFNGNVSMYRMHNSEGTTLRLQEPLYNLTIQAFGLAPDGRPVRDGITFPRRDVADIPTEAQLRSAATDLADHVRALMKAPIGENYTGPVLFEGVAGPQLLAELLTPHLAPPRRPVGEPGRPVPFVASDFEGRADFRVLPDFLDVVDDPTTRTWQNSNLLGSYEVDEEGVFAKPLTLIEKGRLKTLLLTRQPIAGYEGSNGRARLPGRFGARSAAASNLFIRPSEGLATGELRKRFINLVQKSNRPFGIVIRKMDFPSSAGGEELRQIMANAGQAGTTRPVSSPLLIYRLFPDGKEELIRGLRFRNLAVRTLREITAVSSELHALHYLHNGALFNHASGGGYVAPMSVVGPSILFEELELETSRDNVQQPPIVAAPPLPQTSR